MANRRRTCLAAILLVAAPVILVWVLIRGPLTTYVREWRLPSPSEDLLQPGSPEADRGLVDVAAFLPPGTVLFDSFRADLDGDGATETVLIFNDQRKPYEPGMGGALILEDTADGSFQAYEHRPLFEGRVADSAIRDINRDEIPELLIYKSSEDQTSQYLGICQWDGSDLVALSPHDGPLDGQEAFASMFYPPEVRNVDSTGIEEIVVFEDDLSSQRLKAVVYRWNGEAYEGVDWIIMLGPLRPSTETD